jgi:hypothetical protein
MDTSLYTKSLPLQLLPPLLLLPTGLLSSPSCLILLAGSK